MIFLFAIGSFPSFLALASANPRLLLCSIYNALVSSIHLVYASTSGHTEYVAEQVVLALKSAQPNVAVTVERAETVSPESVKQGDLLILASSTWNTGNVEGQLNPHMYQLVHAVLKDIDFAGRPVAVIGLGDLRYTYQCAAADHLEEFVKTHKGALVSPTLRILGEPYGQEEKVKEWVEKLLPSVE